MGIGSHYEVLCQRYSLTKPARVYSRWGLMQRHGLTTGASLPTTRARIPVFYRRISSTNLWFIIHVTYGHVGGG